jgi:cytochrome c5
MRKISLFLIAASILAACKSKKSASSSPAVSTVPGETNLTAAKTKYPDATMDVLKQGHTLYYGTCTNCHAAKDIASRDEGKWPGIIDRMAKKAGINDTEKDAVLKYVMSVKLAAK